MSQNEDFDNYNHKIQNRNSKLNKAKNVELDIDDNEGISKADIKIDFYNKKQPESKYPLGQQQMSSGHKSPPQ